MTTVLSTPFLGFLGCLENSTTTKPSSHWYLEKATWIFPTILCLGPVHIFMLFSVLEWDLNIYESTENTQVDKRGMGLSSKQRDKDSFNLSFCCIKMCALVCFKWLLLSLFGHISKINEFLILNNLIFLTNSSDLCTI